MAADVVSPEVLGDEELDRLSQHWRLHALHGEPGAATVARLLEAEQRRRMRDDSRLRMPPTPSFEDSGWWRLAS